MTCGLSRHVPRRPLKRNMPRTLKHSSEPANRANARNDQKIEASIASIASCKDGSLACRQNSTNE